MELPVPAMFAPLTLGEALEVAGYGHRSSRIEGKREVYRLSDGEIAGIFDAFEAWDFLTSAAPK